MIRDEKTYNQLPDNITFDAKSNKYIIIKFRANVSPDWNNINWLKNMELDLIDELNVRKLNNSINITQINNISDELKQVRNKLKSMKGG